MPSIVNMPEGPKPVVDATVSVVPRVWPATLTVVVVACVTVALSFGFPVQPLMPVSVVAVLPVYVQVTGVSSASTVNFPLVPKSAVFQTVRVPPFRFSAGLWMWTVVVAGGAGGGGGQT